MTKFIRKNFLLLLAPVLPFLLGSCSVWNNFTAYFNLYYNASSRFSEAEQTINEQKKTFFVLQEPRVTAASENLNKVIEKLSKLLQFNSNSGLVDNSLLMLGKSFYYQQEYQKSLRKFTELITTFPESDLTMEARLWLGKTQLRLKNFTQAMETLEKLREDAVKENQTDILSQTYVEEMTYLIYAAKYDEAIATGKELVKISGDDKLNALVMFELGSLYLQTDKKEDAAKAFAEVQNYSPNYDIEYSSKLQYGKVQRNLGKAKAALDIFKDIESEAKYNTYLDSTALQIGLTYLDLQRFEDAFSQLRLVDTTYKQSPNSGIAQYYLGQMMETHFGLYDSAEYYYKRAMSSAAPLEFTQAANKKTQIFGKYDNLDKALTEYNKQLIYLDNPDAFKKDSILYAEQQTLIDSLKKEKAKEKKSVDYMQLGGKAGAQQTSPTQGINYDQVNSPGGRDPKDNNVNLADKDLLKTKLLPQPVKPTITKDSIKVLLAKNEYELGNLFFTEFNVPDSAYKYYSHILGSYPNSPYMGRTLYSLGSYYLTKNEKQKADSLFEIIYDKYKTENIVNAAADKLGKPIINLKFDEAEKLFISAEEKMKENHYHEAVSQLLTLYKQFPRSGFAAKALYTSGWIYENNLKLYDSAAVIYDSVMTRYSNSQYANAVRGKLAAYKAEQVKNRAKLDSLNVKNNLPKNAAPGDSLANKIAPPVNNGQPATNPATPANALKNNTAVPAVDSSKQTPPVNIQPKDAQNNPLPPADSTKKNIQQPENQGRIKNSRVRR